MTVRSGDSALAVSGRLKENKLVKAQNKLKAGVYNFFKKDGMSKMLRNLKSSSGNFLCFTVSEGNNIKQTAD
jgi:cell division protein YceG involved in septum cleavage